MCLPQQRRPSLLRDRLDERKRDNPPNRAQLRVRDAQSAAEAQPREEVPPRLHGLRDVGARRDLRLGHTHGVRPLLCHAASLHERWRRR